MRISDSVTADGVVEPSNSSARAYPPFDGNGPSELAGGWRPVRSGDWSDDCVAGREAAQALVQRIWRSANPNDVQILMRGAFEPEQFRGFEVGFFTAIGEMLYAAR